MGHYLAAKQPLTVSHKFHQKQGPNKKLQKTQQIYQPNMGSSTAAKNIINTSANLNNRQLMEKIQNGGDVFFSQGPVLQDKSHSKT